MAERSARMLAIDVLGKMNFTRPGEVPSERDIQYIVEQWTQTHAELVDDEVIYFDADEIPLAVFKKCAWLTAVESAPGFGALPIVLGALSERSAQTARDAIVADLRTHVAKRPEFDVMPVTSF